MNKAALFYYLASYIVRTGIWSNGVCVVRLKCLKPPTFMISLIFSSPACVPKAGPLAAIEAGTQTIVETAVNLISYENWNMK